MHVVFSASAIDMISAATENKLEKEQRMLSMQLFSVLASRDDAVRDGCCLTMQLFFWDTNSNVLCFFPGCNYIIQ